MPTAGGAPWDWYRCMSLALLTQVARTADGTAQGPAAQHRRVCARIFFPSHHVPVADVVRRGRFVRERGYIRRVGRLGLERILVIPSDCWELLDGLDLDDGRRRGRVLCTECQGRWHAPAPAGHDVGRARVPPCADCQLFGGVLWPAVHPLPRAAARVPGHVDGRRLLLLRTDLGGAGLVAGKGTLQGSPSASASASRTGRT